MSQETTVQKYNLITSGKQSDSLSQACGITLHRDVLEGDVCTLNLQGIGTEGTHGLASRRIDDVGMVVPCDDGVVPVLPTYLDVCQ